jgi:hypothetical protein
MGFKQSTSKLMIAKNSNSNFGGINILFCGDFCQLPPVNEEAKSKNIQINKNGISKKWFFV